MNIEIRNLQKYYGKKIAIKDFNCNIDKGLYGILGRNGAGKTTLFRIIVDLIKPSSGDVIFYKNNKKIDKKDLYNHIGYLPQEYGMYPNFTVQEVMEEICILRNIKKQNRDTIITGLLDKVNLLKEKDKKYKALSGGMKRRLGLAQAMIGNPEILIVDEPTAGVDPKERIYIRKLLNEYSIDKSVILSTHTTEDIEYICQKVLILEEGNLVYDGTIDNLIKNASEELGIVRFSNLEDFQKFSDNNEVFTFRREYGELVAIVPLETSELPAKSLNLEDAYIWKINQRK